MIIQLLNRLVFLFIISLIFSCSSESKKGKLSFNESIKLRQYMVQGKALYETHCINCHQNNGSGLRQLIPPLTSKAYIEENQAKLACILKFGLIGKIEIDGIIFDGNMPSNTALTNLQIAEILTYVGNSWGNELGIINTNNVSESLDNCNTTHP